MDTDTKFSLLWVLVIAFVAYKLGQRSRLNGRRTGFVKTVGDTVAEYTNGGAPIMGPVGAPVPQMGAAPPVLNPYDVSAYGNTGVMPPPGAPNPFGGVLPSVSIQQGDPTGTQLW